MPTREQSPAVAEGREILGKSRLPFFRRGRGEASTGSLQILSCTRSGCDGRFAVLESDYAVLKPTAPCPFCMKVSRVPDLPLTP